MKTFFPRRLGRALVGAALLAVGLAAPPAQAAEAPAVTGTIENLGTPISDFLVLDSVLGKDKSGAPMLYGSTYVANSPGVTFFAVDARTGDLVKQLPMPGSWGGYHTTLGTDGRVYLATLSGDGRAHLWQYDPQTEQVRIAATTPEAGFSFAFGVTSTPWGKIYVGTSPGGRVFEYDPATSGLRDLGQVVAGRTYAKALLPLGDHRLFVGGGAPATATVLDVRTGAKTNILPDQYKDYSFAYNANVVGDNLLVQMVTPDNRVVRYTLDKQRNPTFVGEVPSLTGFSVLRKTPHKLWGPGTCPGATQGLVEFNLKDNSCTRLADDNWITGHLSKLEIHGTDFLVGIGSKGVYGRYNIETGELVRRQLTLPGSPTNITALHTGPDGKIYGGTYETDALFSYDPAAGTTTVHGLVAQGRSGEILSMAATSDRLFIASYTHNVVTVYDPSKPWAPSAQADGNPRDLGEAGEQQYRPWDFVRGSDGNLYLASGAAYGHVGGALTRIDPQTYAMKSWRYLAGDQNLFALAAGQGEVYVGSTDQGDGVSIAGDAQLMVFDEASEAVVYRTAPVPGATAIFALARAGNGTVYGTTSNGQWFRFDPATRTVTPLGGFPLGTALGLATGPDGQVYGTTAGALFRIDPATDTVTTLAGVGSGYYRTIAFDSAGRVYVGSGPSLLRWTP